MIQPFGIDTLINYKNDIWDNKIRFINKRNYRSGLNGTSAVHDYSAWLIFDTENKRITKGISTFDTIIIHSCIFDDIRQPNQVILPLNRVSSVLRNHDLPTLRREYKRNIITNNDINLIEHTKSANIDYKQKFLSGRLQKIDIFRDNQKSSFTIENYYIMVSRESPSQPLDIIKKYVWLHQLSDEPYHYYSNDVLDDLMSNTDDDDLALLQRLIGEQTGFSPT